MTSKTLRTVALREIAEVVTGTTPSTTESEYYVGNIPFITPTELDQVGPIRASRAYLSIEGAAQARLLPKDSVMVCCIGSLGKLGIAGVPLVTNQQINALIVNPLKADPRYVLHACRLLKPILDMIAPSTTVKIVNKSRFSDLQIPLPPLEEQRRVAAILDKADALRQKRRAALQKLDSLTQSLFLDMFGDPAGNPKQWPIVSLADLIHSASDGPHVSPSYEESGVPFLSARHIRPGEVSWTDMKYISRRDAEIHWRKCKPALGDILYTKGGTTGLAAVVDFETEVAVWVHLALLKTDREVVEPVWLESMLNTAFCYRQSQRFTHGIANRDLGLTRMTRIAMYLPPRKVQSQFVDRIRRLKSVRQSHQSSLVTVDSFFSAAQHRAFRGEL